MQLDKQICPHAATTGVGGSPTTATTTRAAQAAWQNAKSSPHHGNHALKSSQIRTRRPPTAPATPRDRQPRESARKPHFKQCERGKTISARARRTPTKRCHSRSKRKHAREVVRKGRTPLRTTPCKERTIIKMAIVLMGVHGGAPARRNEQPNAGMAHLKTPKIVALLGANARTGAAGPNRVTTPTTATLQRTSQVQATDVLTLKGTARFLSNFFMETFTCKGTEWKCVEACFQRLKLSHAQGNDPLSENPHNSDMLAAFQPLSGAQASTDTVDGTCT